MLWTLLACRGHIQHAMDTFSKLETVVALSLLSLGFVIGLFSVLLKVGSHHSLHGSLLPTSYTPAGSLLSYLGACMVIK